MVNNRKFIISGSLFSQYETNINLDLVDSINDIIILVIKNIKEDIKSFPILLKELEKVNYHIHDYHIGDILLSDSNTIFYICDHC